MFGYATEISGQYGIVQLKMVPYEGMKTCCFSKCFISCSSSSMDELPVIGGVRTLEAVDGTQSSK